MYKKIALNVGLAVMLSQSAIAAVKSTSTTLAATNGSVDGGNGNFFTTSVTGLDQFNAALGTLTSVSFTVENAYNVNGSIHNVFVNDDSLDHEIAANISFQISLSKVSGNSGYFFATGVDSIQISCSDSGQDACTDFTSESISNAYSSTEDGTNKLQTNNLFNDFIGTGQVENLELAFVHFSDFQFEILSANNLDTFDAAALLEFEMGPTLIKIDYTYTPVPLPGAAWLFGSAIIGLIGYRLPKRNSGFTF